MSPRPAFVSLFLFAAMLMPLPLLAQTPISAGATVDLGGRVQAQFATSSVDGQAGEFFLRRVRLEADIRVSELLSGRIQPEFSGGDPQLQDAWVRFTFSPDAEITVGQFKRPFDLIDLASSTRLSIIERDGRVAGADDCTGVGGVCTYSRLATRLGFAGRDQGVRVTLGRGPMTLSASVTNGTGINTGDENTGKSVSTRVEWSLGQATTLGGSLGFHDFPVGDETRYANAWNVDLNHGAWADGPHLQVGVIGGENWRAADDADFLAWQAIGSWHFDRQGTISGLEPLIRVSAGDPDTGVADDGGLVWTPGLMFYASGRNKIGFNVDIYSPEGGDAEYSFKAQTFFHF